jgi:hypothetical protein
MGGGGIAVHGFELACHFVFLLFELRLRRDVICSVIPV